MAVTVNAVDVVEVETPSSVQDATAVALYINLAIYAAIFYLMLVHYNVSASNRNITLVCMAITTLLCLLAKNLGTDAYLYSALARGCGVAMAAVALFISGIMFFPYGAFLLI